MGGTGDLLVAALVLRTWESFDLGCLAVDRASVRIHHVSLTLYSLSVIFSAVPQGDSWSRAIRGKVRAENSGWCDPRQRDATPGRALG